MSDFIVKQEGDVSRRCLGVLVFALEIGDILLERSLVLVRERRRWNIYFFTS